MKLFFLIISVCILGTKAFSLSSRVSGAIAKDAPHACMVLVIRPELENTETAALGSGSIVSRTHVLTAAHVVQGRNNRYRINFGSGLSRGSFESTFALTHEGFDPLNNANDLALIFIQGGRMFPPNNVIAISSEVLQAGATCTVSGHGFTSVQTIGFAAANAHSATQRIANACQFEDLEVATSHFCGIDELTTPRGIVCPGDNGAGLYTTTVINGKSVNSLVGVASHILRECSTAALTGYTRISLFTTWINAIIGA